MAHWRGHRELNPEPGVGEVQRSLEIFYNNGSNFCFQGTIVEKASFEALIGEEKCILFIFHRMYSEIPGNEFNY